MASVEWKFNPAGSIRFCWVRCLHRSDLQVPRSCGVFWIQGAETDLIDLILDLHLVQPLLPSAQSLLSPTLKAKVSLSLVAAWTAEARMLQNADKWSMWSSDVWGFSASTCDIDQIMWIVVSCKFLKRIRGTCFGTFDEALGGKAARGRCCRFEEQRPFVLLLWTCKPLKFAKETYWGTKRTKKDQIEENWDEIAEKRKNWNANRTSESSILGVPLKILFCLKGLVEAFLECFYATKKQVPGWRCMMRYSKIVPNMYLTHSLLIPDQDFCGLAKCELLLLAHALPGIHQLLS